MKLLDDIIGKLGSVKDYAGDVLTKLISTEVSYAAGKADANPQVANILSSLAYNETRGVEGDPYTFSQPSGNKDYGKAMGKYQTTEGELKSWGKEFMGKDIDPKEYALSADVQESYMKAKVQKLLEIGATPEEIFAMHRGGLTHFMDPEVRKKKVEERRDYVDSALAHLSSLSDNK